MNRFSFTVTVEGLDPSDDSSADNLYRAGCDDALVSVSQGRMTLDFDRFASSYENAVSSAQKDIETAGARVVRIEPIND